MGLISFKGVYPEVKKMSIGTDIAVVNTSDFYNVPLKIRNIAESEPVVKIGDEVKQGTLIAQPTGKFGVNIFSPVSGKILNIYDRMNSDGEMCKHILVMNNSKNEIESLPEIESVSDVNLITRLKDAGIIDTISGMPAYLKYAFVGSRTYKNLLIMMDSADPNSSVNQTIAEQKMEEVINGAKYFMNVTSASFVTFVFTEANYKLANKLKKHILETKKNYDFKIKFIPNKYPFDNPYVVARVVCKKKISKKTSFLDAGITIESAESCYNFCRAVEFGRPVVSKIVTVDGDNVIRKGNYVVPNGVSFEKVFEFAGIETPDCDMKMIDGNLLSGKAQYNKDISVSLLTNSLVLVKQDILIEQKEYPCISCGKCAGVCPMFLDPMKLDQLYLTEKYDQLPSYGLQSCIECGCCSYVCPAKRFLTQRISAAKVYDKKNRGAK